MLRRFLREHILFDILSIVSIGLVIAGFLVPPTGIIDGSVLMATGELAGWGALYIALIAVLKGTPASISHNNTSITVNKGEEVE